MALWSPDGRTQMSGFPGGAPKINPSGQAQPIQPQSQGTPYGSPTKPPPPGMVYNKAPSSQATNFSAYAPPQQSAPQSNPFAQYNPQQIGNVFQQQSGLPSFQFTATDSFGNKYDNPAALTAQQGAMAQAMNAQRAQQIQSGNIGPLNPVAAYQQAQNMVQGGWTNPFAPPMPNMGSLNNYGYGDTRPPLKSQSPPLAPGLMHPGYGTEEEARQKAYEGRAVSGAWEAWRQSQDGRARNPYLKSISLDEMNARTKAGNGPMVTYQFGGDTFVAPQRGESTFDAYNKWEQDTDQKSKSFKDRWRADFQARNAYNPNEYTVRPAYGGRFYADYVPQGPGQAQPIQPPSQGTPYGQPPQFMRPQEPTQKAAPVLKAPEVWTNPSDPPEFKRHLQSRPDTRPVVWDERNRRYINNPTFAGAPGYEAFLPRPSPAQQPIGGPYGMPLNDALPYDMPVPWGYATALANSRRAAPGRL